MTKLRIAVIRGGPSNEYAVSLKTGATVLKHLDREKYDPIDVHIDRQGAWHADGVPSNLLDLKNKANAAWIALHGSYGEDGTLQRELESVGLPYTGSGIMASALAMHKQQAKDVFVRHGLLVAPGKTVRVSDITDAVVADIFRSLPLPLIVKPVSGGSSVGMTIARSFHDLYEAINRAAEHDSELLVESVIRGREATCGVIEDFRNEQEYALLPIEIIPPPPHNFFSYDAKYSGISQEICPGRFSKAESEAIQDAAKRAHRALGARHYSRSDFIVSPKGIFILETNTLPGLTEESLIPKALEAVGCTLSQFLDHVITQTMKH